MITPRETALLHIKNLMDDNKISPEDILSLYQSHSASTGISGTSTSDSGSMLQRLMIYIGGIFIFVGLCVYIGIIWDDLNSYARIIISLGSGITAFILGLITMNDARFEKAATPLFLISAGLVPSGLFVVLDELFTPTGDMILPSLVVLGITLIQFSLGFLKTNRTSLLFFSLFFFYSFLVFLMQKCAIEPPEGPLILGVTSLVVCRGIDKTSHKSISGFFYFWGGLITAAASYDILAKTPFDVLLIGVSAAMIYLCTVNGSRTLLTISIISLLGYLGYYTDEYFKDIVGWPIALIVMGFVMMGVSVFAVKLGRKIAITEA